MAEEFINQEPEYLNWLEKHPAGFVLNTFKRPKASYLVLHRAFCRSVSIKPKAYKDGEFTSRGFKKVVALQKQDSLDWVNPYSKSFSLVCSKCFKVN